MHILKIAIALGAAFAAYQGAQVLLFGKPADHAKP